MKNFKKHSMTAVLLFVLLCTAFSAVSCNNNGASENNSTTTTVSTTVSGTENPGDITPAAKDMTFTVSVKDQDGNVIPGVTVQLAQGETVAFSGVVDADGKVSGTVKEGTYNVTYDTVPEGYLAIPSNVTLSESSTQIDLTIVNNIPDGTAGRPFVISENETVVNIPAGTTYNYVTFGGEDRTLVIENAKVSVIYKETTYNPDENGIISIPIVVDSQRDRVNFALVNSSEEAVENTVVIYSKPGSMDNPFEITVLDEIQTASVPKDGIVYYIWYANADGVIAVSSDDALNNISITNRTTSRVSYFTNGGAGEYMSVSAGDEILICVSSLNINDEVHELSFKVSLYDGSEENPISVFKDEFSFNFGAEAAYYFAMPAERNKTIVVYGASAEVAIDDLTYHPDDSGKITVPVNKNEGEDIVFYVINYAETSVEIRIEIEAL